MHALIDVKNNIPKFIMLTPGNVHDTQAIPENDRQLSLW